MAAEQEDWLVTEMWSRGTLGIQMEGGVGECVCAEVYFPLESTRQADRLAASLRDLSGAELLAVDEMEDTDWLAAYRNRSRPFPLGAHWLVDPREPLETPSKRAPGRRLLRIPARTAFGTGSHPSTRLIVELMERIEVAGRRVLDVGTGTGILAMVAADRGARQVVGLDVDPAAIWHARENGRLNRLPARLVAGRLAAIRPASGSAGFDLAVVNVLPARIRPELPDLIGCIRPAGEVLVSGLETNQESEWVSELSAVGLRLRYRRESDGWVGLHFEVAEP